MQRALPISYELASNYDINNFHSTEDFIDYVLNELQLEDIDLQNYQLRNNDIKIIAERLKTNTHVKNLTIKCNLLTQEGIAYLATAPLLEELHLTMCDFSDDPELLSSIGNIKVRKLGLYGGNFTTDVVRSVSQNTNLHTLEIFRISSLDIIADMLINNRLTCLSIAVLGDIAPISNALMVNTSLEVLYLYDARSKSWDKFMTALNTNTTLKVLHLRGHEVPKDIFENNLEELRIGNCENVDYSKLETNDTLQTISLDFTEDGARQIADVLRTNKSLKCIEFFNLGNIDVDYFLECLESNYTLEEIEGVKDPRLIKFLSEEERTKRYHRYAYTKKAL